MRPVLESGLCAQDCRWFAPEWAYARGIVPVPRRNRRYAREIVLVPCEHRRYARDRDIALFHVRIQPRTITFPARKPPNLARTPRTRLGMGFSGARPPGPGAESALLARVPPDSARNGLFWRAHPGSGSQASGSGPRQPNPFTSPNHIDPHTNKGTPHFPRMPSIYSALLSHGNSLQIQRQLFDYFSFLVLHPHKVSAMAAVAPAAAMIGPFFNLFSSV